MIFNMQCLVCLPGSFAKEAGMPISIPGFHSFSDGVVSAFASLIQSFAFRKPTLCVLESPQELPMVPYS